MTSIPPNRITELRNARGISLERLGEMTGVQRAAVQKWEKSAVDIPGSRLRQIADALMVQETEIFREHPPAIVNRIRERREAKGLSEQEMADRLGWPLHKVKILEMATRIPADDTVFRVAEILDCGLSALWDEPVMADALDREILHGLSALAEPEKAAYRTIILGKVNNKSG